MPISRKGCSKDKKKHLSITLTFPARNEGKINQSHVASCLLAGWTPFGDFDEGKGDQGSDSSVNWLVFRDHRETTSLSFLFFSPFASVDDDPCLPGSVLPLFLFFPDPWLTELNARRAHQSHHPIPSVVMHSTGNDLNNFASYHIRTSSVLAFYLTARERQETMK